MHGHFNPLFLRLKRSVLLQPCRVGWICLLGWVAGGDGLGWAAPLSEDVVAPREAFRIPGTPGATRTDTQGASLGVFHAQTDVGDPALKGAVDYDMESQRYTVTGAGRNMWFDRDEFNFVWKRLKGDFILRAHATFVGDGSDPHRKLGWMVRSSLEAGSPHVNAVVHGDGLTSLQYRRSAGGPTEEIKSALTAAEVIQLERRGNRFTMSVAREGEPWTRTELAYHDAMGEEVLVGLFVCSHHPEVIEKAVFRNVRVTIPASATFVPYRDYIGSRLETLDVDTGERRVMWETPEPIEAPNWTPDGTTLIYNSRGRLFRFSMADGTTVPLDTGFATRCNNDHVLSFDGTMMGISHHAPEAGGKSVIYVLPATGGVPRRVADGKLAQVPRAEGSDFWVRVIRVRVSFSWRDLAVGACQFPWRESPFSRPSGSAWVGGMFPVGFRRHPLGDL